MLKDGPGPISSGQPVERHAGRRDPSRPAAFGRTGSLRNISAKVRISSSPARVIAGGRAPRRPHGALGALRRAAVLGRPPVLDVEPSQRDASAPEQKGRGDPIDAAVTTAIGPRGRKRVGHGNEANAMEAEKRLKRRRSRSVASLKSHTSRRGSLDASSCLFRPDGQNISEGPNQRQCVGRPVGGRPRPRAAASEVEAAAG